MLTRDEESHGLRRVRYALRSSGVDLEASNPRLAGIHSRGSLPHVKVEGAEYFVTFRLADSLPQEVLQQYEQERLAQIAEAKDIPKCEREAEANREMRRKIEKYLDKGVGQCYLRQPAVANIVASALPFFHNQRYLLGEWVIMPNHVHVMIRPLPNYLLGNILQSLKRFTSREVNKILHRTGQTLWQPESHDHWIRDDAERTGICRYIRHNPVTARLCQSPEQWQWSSAFKL